MKITIACKYFSLRGGAQTFLMNFVRKLREQDHRVRVVTMESHGEMDGVEVRLLPRLRGLKTFRDLAFARATRLALADDDADVTFGEQKAWGADVVRPGGGLHLEYIPQIVRSYPTAFSRALHAVTKRLSAKERLNLHIERRLYAPPGPRLVIANSDLVRRHLLKHYPHLDGRVTVVYNGADCARFHPGLRDEHRARIRAELGLPEDALVGAFCSFDLRRKGLPTVLRALAILKRKPSARQAYALVIGRERGWAARLARRLGVEDRVRWTGLTEPEPYYGASDLLFLPSYFDPCANVTFEGLACGLPAITSVHNGAFERLTPGVDGFYVSDASDAAQFAGFVEHFMDEENLARGRDAARALALSHTLDDMHADIMAALTDLVERKNGDG